MLNRRGFKRVKLKEPIIASIELITLSFSNDLNLKGMVNVHVVDISAGGIRFVSKFEWPVNFLAIYKIHMKVKNYNLVFFGKIIRKTKLINSIFEYGFRFEFELVKQQGMKI
ncbi:PilZ domain-containing protein [Bacillus sp. ISL-18]|uniref:PilZ domain-containing protein n=1 Tax=Bacillus sp. ISL-18 TaxID=2819118 RepID=UPI001BEB0FAE|nr:PilZ domain-containing protein [Bacillus sp. ISL-18]